MENAKKTFTSDAPQYRFGAPEHRVRLIKDARDQFDFFNASLRPDPGFFVLGYDRSPLESNVQELHTTTRLTHSFALGKLAGMPQCENLVDKGMAYLWEFHRDREHGGYLWALDGKNIHDDRKLAYGHAFVLLAGASAKLAGHPDADRLIEDVTHRLDSHYWEDDHGLFSDEYNRNWTPFSTYRGMNANMHGVEALLTAYEATGRDAYLQKAKRILDFLVYKIGAAENWRLPEHYTEDWQIDRSYSGNPMFRPAGTTPGHSFELGRLLLQYWDLTGRPADASIQTAWSLVERALTDAWDNERGGFFYTLNFDGTPAIRDRYWWPVTEAIGVLAAFLKLGDNEDHHMWYSRLWQFADAHYIDHTHGGWFPEIDENGQPTVTQFMGKPDIYHSIQAALFPLSTRLSHIGKDLNGALSA